MSVGSSPRSSHSDRPLGQPDIPAPLSRGEIWGAVAGAAVTLGVLGIAAFAVIAAPPAAPLVLGGLAAVLTTLPPLIKALRRGLRSASRLAEAVITVPSTASAGSGLKQDLDAVTSGLTMPWSSGPVEGRLNHRTRPTGRSSRHG